MAGTEEGARAMMSNRGGATQLVLEVHITGGGGIKQANPQQMTEANGDGVLPQKHLQSAEGRPGQTGKCLPEKE